MVLYWSKFRPLVPHFSCGVLGHGPKVENGQILGHGPKVENGQVKFVLSRFVFNIYPACFLFVEKYKNVIGSGRCVSCLFLPGPVFRHDRPIFIMYLQNLG